MKKILVALTFAAFCLVSFGQTTKAQSCDISNTGPGSTNTCESTSDYRCDVSDDNVLTVTNNNTQVSTTGEISGDGTTGSATNSSGTVITVTITNEGCQVASVTPVTPASTPTPTATPTPTPTVKVLANTGSNDTTTLATAVAGLGLAAVLSTLGVVAYRRLQ